jgi:hypothetical protein
MTNPARWLRPWQHLKKVLRNGSKKRASKSPDIFNVANLGVARQIEFSLPHLLFLEAPRVITDLNLYCGELGRSRSRGNGTTSFFHLLGGKR